MERRIAMEPQVPRYNANHVTIPLSVFKEEKEPKFVCSICYDGAITLLLNHAITFVFVNCATIL